MAKLNFKDLIFKFLQKDEDHDCEKVHPKMSHKEWMNTEPVSMYKGESYKSDYEKEQPIKVKKAIEIAKRMAGNYTGATKEIEKIAKGLSQLPVVKSVLMRVNESNDMGFVVKFAKKKDGKIETAWYRSKEDAEKALASLKKDGLNGIISKGRMDEEAPANATGTAVAGTGDDSSTVVVRKKKKKELQSKLMRRLKIKEAIDKAIPDLEYPKDPIRERTEQLKGFAKEYKEDNRDDDVTGKKVFKPAKHMPKDSAGKLDVTEPTIGSPLNKVAKVHNTNKARHSIMGTPSTQYKGLAFKHSVPNYTKA